MKNQSETTLSQRQGTAAVTESVTEGLAEKIDEEQNIWSVTDKGTEYLEEIGKEIPSQTSVTGITPPPETGPTIPSEADLFRREGEGLGVGMKKGNVPLDAIIYYVQRTANLDDLNLILPTCGAP